jgi:hypothetical protein
MTKNRSSKSRARVPLRSMLHSVPIFPRPTVQHVEVIDT